MRGSTLILSARYIFPVEGPPIPGGRITISDGKVVRLDPRGKGPRADVDLGNVAITPGLVNAHTHLELGPIAPAGPLPEDEVDWLRRVVEGRRASPPGSGTETAVRNVRASLEAGTTLLADITTAGQSWEPIADANLRAVVFTELIGLNRLRGIETTGKAFEWLARVRTDDPAARIRPGLSPHAPYSTAGWLYHRAATTNLPLSTHLAEMPEEDELLRTRRGRLRQFLEELGAWDDDWEPIGTRPADYIRRGDLRQSDWLIAHGNYFTPDEFWQLRPEAAPNHQRVAVAYCPRTHARFGHAPHPYRSMLDRGIIVCLGTDSLASSPTLSILDEIRFLHRIDGSASGELLLTMATLFGAWALRVESVTGSLKAGKSADMAIIELPNRDEADPHALIFESDRPVVATLFQGQFVHGARP